MTTIETARLILRRWRPADIAPMAAINADDEVMRWIGAGVGIPYDRTEASLAAAERHWDELGYGWFAVEVRDTGMLAGLAGLGIPDDIPDVMPAVEIGWRLGRAFWGQGIATEAARASLRFAFADRGMDRILGIHQIGNHASERIMHKLGMRPMLESTEPPLDRPVRVHAITRVEYDRLTDPAATASD
ncbi:MAG: GNAT family N-acetyltransferase [Mycobacteriales bacterium]